MDIIDPHAHMYSRVTDDYERMALAGIRMVIEPAFWLGGRRRYAGTFYDYFYHILEFEAERAANHGLAHYCCIAVNPRESNDTALTNEVLDNLGEFLAHDHAVAVGEIGFDDITDAEEASIRRQLEIALEHDLPVMIHTPHKNKLEGTQRTIAILKDMDYPEDMVLIDHNTEETIGLVRGETDCWAGHTVYPVTKLSPERAANILEEYGPEKMLINSSADWGPADPLNVPKTVHELRRRAFDEASIRTIVWDNPFSFFNKSGKIVL